MNKYNIECMIDSLENLEQRLIDEYNGISEFEQQGQDRLDVRHAIDYIKRQASGKQFEDERKTN